MPAQWQTSFLAASVWWRGSRSSGELRLQRWSRSSTPRCFEATKSL